MLSCAIGITFAGDPVEWSKNHRWHHLHSDSPADRHSPRDGLWHAHMGWLFDEQLAGTRKDGKGNMKDSLAPPWFFKCVCNGYRHKLYLSCDKFIAVEHCFLAPTCKSSLMTRTVQTASNK